MNGGPVETAALAARFGPTLAAWQRAEGRHALPWQPAGAPDAYRIWLSEVMLQQTQVAAVIPFYTRFLERFPTVEALAAAPLDDVMACWSGLGYYSRARNLHRAARMVVDDFGGVFPNDPTVLQRLPGVGRSTAAAIAVFAFGARAAILDGNVKRVLARVFAIDGVVSSGAVTQRLWSLAESLLPGHDLGAYTQGLMDLGATVCTPRRPACILCPFERDCLAHRDGREEALPLRAVRKPLPERRSTLLVVAAGDAILIERRPPIGIWGGLWSLPEAGADESEVELRSRLEAFGSIRSLEACPGFRHGFTHFVLNARVLRVRLEDALLSTTAAEGDRLRWVRADELDRLGVPAPVRTLLAHDGWSGV